MKVGYQSMNTPEDLAPGDLARMLESRGYESLWLGEHPHIPCGRKTPYPAGGEMPEEYKRMMDPFISLALAAAATRSLRIGTGVALPLEHDVFDFAKTVATLDYQSNGRLLLGIGTGWNEEELANCRPIAWKQRYRALAECVGALRALWSTEEAEFHGRYFDFDPVWCEPKPAQQAGPPLLCGMAGKLGTRHAVEWADGWLPMDVGLGDVPKKLGLFRRAAADVGRDLPVTIVAWGDPDRDTLLKYRELEVERVVIGAARKGQGDPTTTQQFIDRYAQLIPDLA